MNDLVRERDAYTRLEQALARVEVAATQLKREHRRAQARYELLDRVGCEVLALLDTMKGEPAAPMLRLEAPVRVSVPEPKQVAPITTADAA